MCYAVLCHSPSQNKITLEHLTETYNFNFDRVFEPLATQEAMVDAG